MKIFSMIRTYFMLLTSVFLLGNAALASSADEITGAPPAIVTTTVQYPHLAELPFIVPLDRLKATGNEHVGDWNLDFTLTAMNTALRLHAEASQSPHAPISADIQTGLDTVTKYSHILAELFAKLSNGDSDKDLVEWLKPHVEALGTKCDEMRDAILDWAFGASSSAATRNTNAIIAYLSDYLQSIHDELAAAEDIS
jgi:hypothetical protein